MLFAVLEFFDFVIIGLMIVVLAGGTTMASRRTGANAAAGERLRRLEEKVNLLLAHQEIEYVPSKKERWQRLAESGDKAGAVKEYGETYSVSSEEAEDVVEQYQEDIFRAT